MAVTGSGPPGATGDDGQGGRAPARWSRRAVLLGVPVAAVGGWLAVRHRWSGEGAGSSAAPDAEDAALLAGASTTIATPPSSTLPVTTVPAPATPTTTVTAPPATVDRGAVVARHLGERPTAFGLDLPGLVPSVGAGGRVALTFDACGGQGGSAVDQPLLDLLVREQVPATLFLNARWIEANPAAVELILSHPQFEVANHGTRHVPLCVDGRSAYGIRGTTSVQEVVDEVGTNHDRLTALLGRPPRWFRPGTAHYDDVAVRIVGDLGERPAGFAVNGDAGATLPAAKVASLVGAAPDGGVVLMHMNHPGGGTAPGVADALARLRARGLRPCTMSEALGA